MTNTTKLCDIESSLLTLGDTVAASAVRRSIAQGASNLAVDFHTTILKVKKRQLLEYGKIFKSYRR